MVITPNAGKFIVFLFNIFLCTFESLYSFFILKKNTRKSDKFREQQN